MKQNLLSLVLAAAMLLGTQLCIAVDSSADAAPQAASEAKVAPKVVHSHKRKASARIKLVDINSASRNQMKTLPGIGNAEADKIIAGRPYGTKAHLVTQNVIPLAVYQGLRNRIVAQQPYTDGAKNAAIYSKKK